MNIKSKISNSPVAQAVVSVFGLIVAGILVGAFIAEINVDCGVLDWRSCYRSHTFWYIIAFITLIFVYYRFFYEFSPESVEEYKDKKYLQARAAKECFPELIKQMKKEIREKGTKSYNNIMKGLK